MPADAWDAEEVWRSARIPSAAHESWNVWLIGSSNRWAAVAIMLIGAVTCGFGSAADEMSQEGGVGPATKFLAGVGVVAGVLAIWRS